MSQPALLKRVVEALDAASVDYMITGSVASSLQGEPRLTHVLDVLIAIETTKIANLLSAFPKPEFYVDAEAARDAIRTNGMFNVIDTVDGDKVDFWILTDEPFDHSRFARRYVEQVFDFPLRVSSPEDTILAKLRWSKLSGGSEKQFRDALRVYEVQGDRLDQSYLSEWWMN
ncbi:MAG: hypothetical protein ACREL7_19445 [Longimicrobiales bacterium]